MNKLIILSKIHVKMKSFRTIIERTKHIQASAANLLHTVLELEIFVGANARSSHWRCSVKMGVLKISQNSQKNNCGRVSF